MILRIICDIYLLLVHIVDIRFNWQFNYYWSRFYEIVLYASKFGARDLVWKKKILFLLFKYL